MLSVLAFSAVHMNVASATQSFGNTQVSVSHHVELPEGEQSDHFLCANEMQSALNYRTDTEYLDDLLDCPIAHISTSSENASNEFIWTRSSEEFSKKPITLTHNITLQI